MTITLTREEAQQVLDALNSCDETWVYDGEFEQIVDQYDHELVAKALETLRARLAQPEPEPVMLMDAPLLLNGQPLYTAPPQRERVQFPTMLRKMWSGTEVQAWLDENVNQENNNE